MRDILQDYERYLTRPIEVVEADLESFFQLLTKWQAAQNLVSRETLTDFWHRHIADSLQILNFLRDEDQRVVDFGSGGGFPAIPLLIARHGSEIQVQMIEANQRKCSFLRTVIRELKLNGIVHASRAESLNIDNLRRIDLFTSRATAELSLLLEWIYPLWNEGAHTLLHKGRKFREEVKAAGDHWDLDMVDYSSRTEEAAAILEITSLDRKK